MQIDDAIRITKAVCEESGFNIVFMEDKRIKIEKLGAILQFSTVSCFYGEIEIPYNFDFYRKMKKMVNSYKDNKLEINHLRIR